ncbi:MAG: 50S ribosomal protein L3 [Opitutae bacterium]|jgi:large subunit ribosomal protein L3|nr:50S ribosomal protein L3 [Opitutae bacterium]NBY41891.1 50S ribosomal protein L3 [Verrucomicrobiota bacterium]NDD70434.1 50S ribosomal protein L3 [bacterium]
MKHQLLGKKIGMTQVYDAENNLVPVTVVQAGPCPVTQVKTVETDGYHAVQIGFGPNKESRLSAGEIGHLKKAGVSAHNHLQEIRLAAAAEVKVGDIFTVEKFAAGQMVDVIGTVKGRGFQGVMKRHDMSGQPDSHGHMMHRRIGSIGMRQTPGHVFKGKRMPGHMGSVRRTVQNLRVVQVLAEKNLLLIKGSFPGANGELVLVRPAKKSK